jgi:hypothetical protein
MLLSARLAMNSLHERFPNLFHLLAGYFHQDCLLDDPTPEAIIQRFKRESSAAEILAVLGEIDEFLAIDWKKQGLSGVPIYQLCCGYDGTADGFADHAEWLRWVQRQL